MESGAIVTRDLTKQFGRLSAVEGLTLDVRRGEVFGFLGPNGAGKTTTIRLLLDFLRPTRGSLVVLGGTCADPGVRRRLGYLPAELHLDPRYTGDDVLAFFGALRGEVDRNRLTALVERFELDTTRPIGDLSTGNRRKIGIVQAFMHSPDVLILDEPTGGLDPLLQHEFLLLVREVVAAGATVFLSSHVLHEVEQVADRVGILREGRLVELVDVDELRRLARQRIELTVSEDVDPSLFANVPGVVDVTVHAGLVRLVVEGSVDAVLKVAAGLTVDRIVSEQVALEEVFLDYYRAGDR